MKEVQQIIMLEKDIERRLVNGVRALGGRAYKFVSPGNIGVPDRLVVLPGGRVIFVELKTERGKLSPMQEVQLQNLAELGAAVGVLWGIDDVNNFLEEVKNNEI